MCLGVDFFVLCLVFSQLLGNFHLFFLQMFFGITLFFVSVLDSSYTNVRLFIVIIQVLDTLVLPLNLFSFCYLNWLVCLSIFSFTVSSILLLCSFSEFFISVILFSSSKVLIWLSFISSLYFANNFLLKFISRVFKFGDCSFEHFCNSCFNLLVREFQHLCHLTVGICWLSFPMWVGIFVFYVPSDFGFYPGHFEYYVIMLLDSGSCFNLMENVDNLCSSQLTWLGSYCKFQLTFCSGL